MSRIAPLMASLIALSVVTLASPAAADDPYLGADGYVRDDAAGGDAVIVDPQTSVEREVVDADGNTYIVIEADEGTEQEVNGETVIVVTEPEPTAASEEAPPEPQTVVVERPAPPYDGAIWVDGYWTNT